MELNIIDFRYLYYRYKYTHQAGKLRELTYQDMDITLLYYPLREVELLSDKGEVNTAVCFEPEIATLRTQFKGEVVMDGYDYKNILEIQRILNNVGYSTYSSSAHTTHDLVKSLCKKSYPHYDHIHVYSDDNKLLQFVTDKITLHLYKSRKGYITITPENFEDSVAELFKTYIPYNAIGLYWCLCGDNKQQIKGVKGFGKTKFINWINDHEEMDFSKLTNLNRIYEVLNEEFKGSTLDQALLALNGLAYTYKRDIELPSYTGNESTRVDTYGAYGIHSLI